MLYESIRMLTKIIVDISGTSMVVFGVFACTEPRSATIPPRRSVHFFSRPAFVSCSHEPLSPLQCALTSCCLSYKQIAPATRLECVLTGHSQLTENTTTLSLAESALTDLAPVSSLEYAVTKNTGGWGVVPSSR